jgi:hypothetical protein
MPFPRLPFRNDSRDFEVPGEGNAPRGCALAMILIFQGAAWLIIGILIGNFLWSHNTVIKHRDHSFLSNN